MKKKLVGILASIIFLFALNGVEVETPLMSPVEFSATELSADDNNQNCLTQDGIEAGELSGYNYFLLNVFTNAIICDVLVSTYALPRGVSFPRNLKFSSVALSLSALKTLQVKGNFMHLNFDSCFTKFSNQYFVYTLRRLLI